MKILQLIRHGHSLHNELFEKIGVKAFKNQDMIDAPLTQEGHIQSVELGESFENKYNIELVLVSPLTRTLETSMNIFGDMRIPIECHEFLREYPIGDDTCNKRSSLREIKRKFPKIDFKLNMEEDKLWSEDYRETITGLEKRIKLMINYIQNRRETNIAIVGHSSYLGQFKDYHIGYKENGEKDLEHCKPYEFQLEPNYKRKNID